jgi:hypothetical protein
MTPSYIELYVAQTSVTHFLIYMFLSHNKDKLKNDTRKNNKVEEQNPTRKIGL